MPTAEVQRQTTAAYDLYLPETITCPLVVDSPHSWNAYPEGFHPACARNDLLTSWDAWIDELFDCTPRLGAPLLAARFPRFFLDLNRGRDDIDPDIVQGDLPFPLRPTDKTAKGFGLLRRYALPGVAVYDAAIPAARLLRDIETYYDPYHEKLRDLVDHARNCFGGVVHLDCHSMKSRGNAMNDDNGAARPDVVVSDNFGRTASPDLTARLAALFTEAGLRTQVNDPYKGAELIRRHDSPSDNRHSLQIELNRALYMDEAAFEKSGNFVDLKRQIDWVLTTFADEMSVAWPKKTQIARGM